jgi:hypothetical protein
VLIFEVLSQISIALKFVFVFGHEPILNETCFLLLGKFLVFLSSSCQELCIELCKEIEEDSKP